MSTEGIFDYAMAGISHEVLQSLYQKTVDLPRRNGRMNSLRAIPPPGAFTHAADYVDGTGLDKLFEQWLGEDHPRRLLFTPTERVTVRNFLVVTFACAFAGIPTAWLTVHGAMTCELPKAVRAAAGFPTSQDPKEDAALDEQRRMIAYSTVAHAGKRLGAAIDPRPFPTRTALTREQADAIDLMRDPDEMAKKQRRFEVLLGITLLAQFQMLPPEVRALWRGDLSADQTILPGWGRWGHSSKSRQDEDSISPDVLAGLHVKKADDRDKANQPGFKTNAEITHGVMSTFGVMVAEPGEPVAPPLILAFGMDTPGLNPGVNLAGATRAIVDAGLPVGRMTVDMGYSQQLGENYAFLLRAQGYRLVHMFKKDEHGKILATHGGLNLIEGRVYGPCLPDHLRYAVRDFKDKKIDADLFEQRIKARLDYEARPKSGTDGMTTWVFRCPGMGRGRTVACDYQPASEEQEAWEARAGRTLPFIVTQPADKPRCCANNASVSVPAKKFARHLLDMPYKSPEWRAYYASARNQMEGKNGFVKNPLGANIAEKGQRRMRGIGKQAIAILPRVVYANFQAIGTWINDEEDGKHIVVSPPTKLGRPKTPGLEEYEIGPNAPPLKIFGPAIPDSPHVA